MKIKYIKLSFILISIISVIISFHLFLKEQVILDINFRNRKSFLDVIKDDKIDNKNSITKIALGNGWHSGELYVYYSSGEIKEYNSIASSDLRQYILENGYSLDSIAKIFLLMPIVNLILYVILKRNKIY